MTGTTNTHTTVLSIQPMTENELLLLSALHESEAHVQHIKVHAFELQASNILNEAYADHLKKQLTAKEEKKGKKKSIKLVSNGLPHLLTADKFYEPAKEKEKEACEEARDKETCKEAWQLYTAAITSWKVADEKRKEDVAEARAKNKRANDTFKKKQEAAKKRGKKLGASDKPALIPVPKAIPWPKLKDFMEGSVPEQAGDNDSDGGDEDDKGFGMDRGSGGSEEDDKDDDDE